MGNLIGVPFQKLPNVDVGPLSRTQNVLEIEPVIPMELDKDWSLITRTILPLV